MKKLFALLLAALMVFAVVACAPAEKPQDTTAGQETTPVETTPAVVVDPADEPNYYKLAYGEDADYISLWDKYGKEVTLDDVKEDGEKLAYIEKDGKTFYLGLDFLTMAMVYTVDEQADEETRNANYATWWRYYITRWNYLLPEIPLYSNEYYDVYNKKLSGVEENPSNPYWSVPNALIDWKSEDGKIIIGNTTDLSGTFRYSSFGVSSPGAADNDVAGMISGLATVCTNKEGNYQWDTTVVKEHKEELDADGNKTYTITINDDLKFSDGTPIKAVNYLVFVMAFSTPVQTEASGAASKAGFNYVGFDEFSKYNGKEEEGASKVFSGIRLLGDYTFSVTVKADNLPYFYDIGYASFAPEATALWLGDAEIKDDGEGCYITDNFYDGNHDEVIAKNAKNTDTTIPYAGPYVVESYDTATKTATLKANENYKGNYEGTKPSIETVVYKKIVSETQLADFKAGGVDVLCDITGGDETNEAVAACDAEPEKYGYTHYSRAGYGKLGFRCDFGPTRFEEVRQAVAYCMDRAQFAKDFTGGYGGVVDGPYYSGSWMYKLALADGMELSAYATSADKAIEVLEAGGWNYDAEGNAYTEGIRYKKIAAAEMTDADKSFQSKDGKYVTTQVGDYYYMPLILNWYGTEDNPFTDLLVTGLQTAETVKQIGMEVQNTIGQFYPMLAELSQCDYGDAVYGGTPLYNTFNFATGFNSAVYDFSYNMTVDPDWYDDYSSYYIKDVADFYLLGEAAE